MSVKEAKDSNKWDLFFSRCMRDHVAFDKFPEELRKQKYQSPLPSRCIFEAWAGQKNGDMRIQERLLCYLELLVHTGNLADAEVLQCLRQCFQSNTKASPTKYLARSRQWKQSTEAAVLDRLSFQTMQRRMTSPGPSDRVAVIQIAKPLIGFLSDFTRAFENVSPLSGAEIELGNALGQYVGAYINELSKFGLLTCRNGGPPTDLKVWFGRRLPPFVTLLSASNAQLGQALDMLQKQSGLHEEALTAILDDGVVNGLDLNALTYQENVLDTPTIITRAALFIFLNAMLTGRPIYDDTAIFHYLNARYNGGIPTLVTDLITASFDILANAINRSEPNGSILIYRSFLTNKLPLLLESYSTMIFAPYNVEACITEALGRMDPPADPYSTQSFDLLDSSGMLSEARAEFLFSCALYRLIPEQSIESILGDVPMQSLPEAGKYLKADLVAQCTMNSTRIEELVVELENMEGNGAEIAGALIEIVQSLCTTKDTMTLKIICNVLSRKAQALDVLMLFCQPITILQPLCELLDHWQTHEDQGEHHPVYDEFGSILLFILVCRQRFELPDSELGIKYTDSFVLKYNRRGRSPSDPNELSEPEKRVLGGWIKGLFETEGISDELMSTCSPQDFYLLVATLFSQSFRACEAGVLGLETLKGGLEYLLEPFLLPSLVAGLSWYTHRLLSLGPTPTSALAILLPTLSLLIHPPSLSSDALSLHEAVLAAVATPLEHALSRIQKAQPRRQDIDRLVATLKARTRLPRCALASSSELEAWCSIQGGGILAAVHNSVTALLHWSTTGGSHAAPPKYTHRLLLTSVSMLGARVVIDTLLDAILKHAETAPDVVLDVVTAMISAPQAADRNERLALRHALQAAYGDAYALSKRDAARAEMVVRLYRRVETQDAREGAAEIPEGLDVDAAMEAAVAAGNSGLLLDMEDGTGAGANGQSTMADVMGAGMDMDLQMADVMADVGSAEEFLAM
ncbi:mediator complex subunit [Lambiella insularis]|nr:mediator complex subunit [Lambiella insularis]